jgi:pilus assembly protein Flp/PilA
MEHISQADEIHYKEFACKSLMKPEVVRCSRYFRRSLGEKGGGWPMKNPSTRRQRGQGMVEYALILVLVSIVVIVILLTMGNQIQNVFSNVVAALG